MPNGLSGIEAPVCRRCLLADMESEQPLARLIQSYVDSLLPEQRAGETVYRERLARCSACDRLQNGMCVLCGCYVEARAAKASQRCPDRIDRWRAAAGK